MHQIACHINLHEAAAAHRLARALLLGAGEELSMHHPRDFLRVLVRFCESAASAGATGDALLVLGFTRDLAPGVRKVHSMIAALSQLPAGPPADGDVDAFIARLRGAHAQPARAMAHEGGDETAAARRALPASLCSLSQARRLHASGARVWVPALQRLAPLPLRFRCTIDTCETRLYGCVASRDGTRLYSYAQDWFVRQYDATQPEAPVRLAMLPTAVGRWALTDVALGGPGDAVLVCSTIGPAVNVLRLDERGIAAASELRLATDWCGVWSVALSQCGRELIAGTSLEGAVKIMDVERGRELGTGSGHTDDANAVVYADASENVLLSGSDDTCICVFDKRALANGAVGVLAGHWEGVCSLAVRGDGYTVASTGKDQCVKLWDLRRSLSPATTERLGARLPGWDYRTSEYPLNPTMLPRHPHDTSLVTMHGLAVLQTLIRVRFSPQHSTGQAYVVSGSADGRAYMWSLAGELVGTVACSGNSNGHAVSAVRDVCWLDGRLLLTSFDGALDCFCV